MICSFVVEKSVLQIYIQTLESLTDFTISYFPYNSTESETAAEWQILIYTDTPQVAIKLIQDTRTKFNLPVTEITTTEVEDKDWVTEVQKNFKPILVENIYIYSSYYQDSLAQHQASLCINIDPGNAFGTGEHHTTKGCLKALAQLSKHSSFDKILDMGSGSAILAIAAAKLFKNSTILATDIDPDAVKVAHENIAKNNVSHLVTTEHADGIDHPAIKSQSPFDLIICNILSSVLIQISQDIDVISTRGTIIVLSGLTTRQLEDVTNSYTRHSFKTLEVIEEDEWCTIVMKKER
jgi:ribosomal protein L11 methyltransferase